jgi:hypothetical protein
MGGFKIFHAGSIVPKARPLWNTLGYNFLHVHPKGCASVLLTVFFILTEILPSIPLQEQ